MNAEFARIDYAISTATPGILGYANQNGLEQLTRQYVDTTRKYPDDLGDREVKRGSRSRPNQLAPWCPPCVGILKQELESY